MSYKVIKAALNGEKNKKGKCFFFNGPRMIQYDWGKGKPDLYYPKLMGIAMGKDDLHLDLDAALNGREQFEGYYYFFKGGRYATYHWDKGDSPLGEPKSLNLWSLKGEFLKGIDAACNGKGYYEGQGYLFKGNKYLAYDWAKDAPADNKERDIAEWKLPKEFNTGVDAALDGDGPFSNFTYFFKGHKYTKYDWTSYEGTGPYLISDFWKIENTLESDARDLYRKFGLEGKIAFEAFRLAYLGFNHIGDLHEIPQLNKTNHRGEKETLRYDNSTGYLSIIDFTKPSNEPRMVVLNMKDKTVRNYIHVSHGVNTSGEKWSERSNAQNFSNTKGSNKSSLGFYVTGWPFPKDKVKNGVVDERVWLKLHGMELGINDQAQARGIMMHTANYVSEAKGKAGSSHGCPAIDGFENQIVEGKRINTLFEEIKNGSLLFAYTTREHASDEHGRNYYDHSDIIPRLEEFASSSFGVVH